MTTLFRRAKAAIMSLLSSAADASTVTGIPQMYGRTWAGSVEAMAKDGSGEIYQVTPFFGPCRMSYYYLDDFLTNSVSTAAVAGAGTSSSLTAGSVQGSPGVQRSTFVGVTSRVVLLISASGSTASSFVMNGHHIFEGRCLTTTAQDGTDQWSDRWGTGDAIAAADAIDGIYFECDRTTNGDNNVRLCAASGGTRTKTSMGVAPTAGTFQRWKYIVNAAFTSVQGYLDDVLTGSAVTANLPTATLTATWWAQCVKTAGSNARTVDRDYLESYEIFNTPR